MAFKHVKVKHKFKANLKAEGGNSSVKKIMVKDATWEEVEAIMFEWYASTNDKDRVDDVVVPGAFYNLKEYLSDNPVLLLQHDYDQFVWYVDAGVQDDKWLDIVWVVTIDRNNIFKALTTGVIRTMSIWYSIDTKDITVTEDANWEITYNLNRIELYEISLVSVPANPKATLKNFTWQLNDKRLKSLSDEEFRKQFDVEQKMFEDYPFYQSISQKMNEIILKLQKQSREDLIERKGDTFLKCSEEMQTKLINKGVKEMIEESDDQEVIDAGVEAEIIDAPTDDVDAGSDTDVDTDGKDVDTLEVKDEWGEDDADDDVDTGGDEDQDDAEDFEEVEVEWEKTIVPNQEKAEKSITEHVKEVTSDSIKAWDMIRFKFIDTCRGWKWVENAEVIMVKSEWSFWKREASAEDPVLLFDIYDMDLDGFKSSWCTVSYNMSEITMVDIDDSYLKEAREWEAKTIENFVKSQEKDSGWDTPQKKSLSKKLDIDVKTVIAGEIDSAMAKHEKSFVSQKAFDDYKKELKKDFSENVVPLLQKSLTKQFQSEFDRIDDLKKTLLKWFKYIESVQNAVSKIRFSKWATGNVPAIDWDPQEVQTELWHKLWAAIRKKS